VLFSSCETEKFSRTCRGKKKSDVWTSWGDINKSVNIQGPAPDGPTRKGIDLRREGMITMEHLKQVENTSM
jgi:hypothetical protein